MLQGIVCWGKSKTGTCNYYKTYDIDEDIKIAKLCLSNISILESKLVRCIEKNSIEDVLGFKGDYIDKYYWDKIKQKEQDKRFYNGEEIFSKRRSTCKLKPDVCAIILENENNIFNEFMKEVEDKIKKYNTNLVILKKVQNYCLKESGYDEVYRNKDIYFKFDRDKYGSLIALYFNMKSFVQSNNQGPIETIYLFSGDGESPYHKNSVLHLKYEEFGLFSLSGTKVYEEVKIDNDVGAQVHICDFISNNQKRGHGSFILQNLEDIIKQVNKRIIIQQKTERYPRMKIIKAINGEVCPAGIPFEALVRFYNKNGFPTIGKVYDKGGYEKDRIIYKKLLESAK